MPHLLRSGSFLTSHSTALRLAALEQSCKRVHVLQATSRAKHCPSEASPSEALSCKQPRERSESERPYSGSEERVERWDRGMSRHNSVYKVVDSWGRGRGQLRFVHRPTVTDLKGVGIGDDRVHSQVSRDQGKRHVIPNPQVLLPLLDR